MKIKSLIQLTGAAALIPLASSAATIAWDGLGDGLTFADGNNWGGIAPLSDTTTDIAQLTGGSVTLDADRSVNGLDINSASTLTGTGTRLTLGGGGLTGSSDFTLGGGVILRTGTVSSATGGLTIDGSILEVATGSQGFIGTGTVTLDNGGMIFDATNQNLNMRDTTSIILGAGGGVFRNASNKAFYGLDNAVISGVGQLKLDGGGSDNYAGNARIQIASANGGNTYTGGTLITNKANVQVNADNNFGATAGKVTIDDGRLVTVNNIGFDAAREFEIASGGGRISLNRKSSTINSALTGVGALTIDGQSRDGDANDASNYGTLSLNGGASTMTGDVLIDSATVRFGTGGTLGSGVLTLDNGGELHGNHHLDLSGNSSIILGENGGTIKTRHARNVYGLSDVVISGSGALTLDSESGAGRIQMEGTNTYTGGTIFKNQAPVRANSNASLGDAAGSVTFDGGVLQNNNSNIDLGARAIILEAGGGTLFVGWNNRRITSDGVISGVGKLTIADDGSTVQLTGANTYSGGTEIQGFIYAGTDTLGTGVVTLNDVDGSRGQLQNNEGASTLSNNVIIDDTNNGGRMKAGWSSNLEVTGVVSGAGDLSIEGDSGTVILSNTGNTFTGNINLVSSTSRLSVASLGGGAYNGVISGDAAATFNWIGDGTFSGTNDFAGATIVADGASIGGSGSFAGDLTLETGSKFIFSDTDTLTVSGAVSLFSGFGVDDIDGLDESTTIGSFTLIEGTSSDFSGVDNFGQENWLSIGGGKFAYFQNGSLELVVAVPEPGTFALLAGMLALGSVMIRRRRA